jgi:hypothetical protein
MPILTLHIIASKLTRELGPFASEGWGLHLPAKFSGDDKLRLATGEDTKDVTIYANFKTVTAEGRARYFKDFSAWGDLSDAVGILIYLPDPGTLFFEIFVADALFADLIEFARHGRYPTRLTVHVANGIGIEYGGNYIDRFAVWDNNSSKCVPLERVQFDMTIAEPAVDPEPPFGSILLPELRRLLFWQKVAYFLVLIIGFLLFFRR